MGAVSEKWGKRPSEIIELEEDPYTKYCFDEAVAFALALERSKNVPKENNGSFGNSYKQFGSGSRKRQGQTFNNALELMTQEKYREDS